MRIDSLNDEQISIFVGWPHFPHLYYLGYRSINILILDKQDIKVEFVYVIQLNGLLISNTIISPKGTALPSLWASTVFSFYFL